jgi:CRISPR-associated endonuclease/helicase Cas3
MSASLPECVLSDYQKIGFSVETIIEDTTDSDRDRFNIQSITEYNSLSDIEPILDKCIDVGAAIIYVNTVDRAMLFYDYFKKKEVDTIVYHSRFTEPDKKLKEEALIKALGKAKWIKNEAKGIAILTQIGEMSINISADIMISELCPIDRLTQRAGRLCRFDKDKIGELHIIVPQKNGEVYPAPYGQYSRKEKKWTPVDSFVKTQNSLELKNYNAKNLVLLLNEIYSKQYEYSALSQNNARMLKDNFQYNWLINPSQKTAEDDTDTNQWKSRNIGAQDTVFVMKPASAYFKNYLEFQSWKLSVAIEIPIYVIEQYRKNHIVDLLPIVISNENDSIWVIREEYYDFDRGISLPDDDQFY